MPPREVVGKIPEFTSDEGGDKEEVKQAGDQETPEEKETPTEPSTEKKPADEETVSEEKITSDEETEEPLGEDIGGEKEELLKSIEGLKAAREKLLEDIKYLRGERRELKQKQIDKINEEIDELKDLHPDDVKVIERVLKAKGYVPKQEIEKELYNQIKQQQLDRFLDKYPEFKPENDPDDKNWTALQEELKYYRMPEDPNKIMTILERAYRAISPLISSNDRSTLAKKQQIKTAGVGAGGGQRSSSKKTLSPRYRQELERGGWSKEEIKEIEQSLPEE